MEVGSLAYAVGVVSDSKGVGEAVGCTADSRNAVAAALDHGADWKPAVDTSNPDLGPGLCPCPFVLGDDVHVPDNLDVAEGEAVVGTLADW